LNDLAAGLTRILFGLFRKIVLADRFAILADHVFANPDGFSTWSVWGGLLAFTAQIYFDFSGYSDIAIGSARLFGVRLTENFKRPLLARSIADFWNRWHITLTSWLRDYLFTPLGGYRKGAARAMFNGLFVLTLCGLWHGASWHFVFWGVFHGTVMILFYLWRAVKKRLGWKSSERHLRPGLIVSIVLTYLATSCSCVFFRSPDMNTVGKMFRGLAGLHPGAHLATPWVIWVFLGMILCVMAVEFCQEFFALNGRLKRLPWPVRAGALAALAVLIMLASVNSNAPYIYFQF
jgi:D-alanyl-lipoteichoic acid acyltransferase DltB (MBOAT superfamily)